MTTSGEHRGTIGIDVGSDSAAFAEALIASMRRQLTGFVGPRLHPSGRELTPTEIDQPYYSAAVQLLMGVWETHHGDNSASLILALATAMGSLFSRAEDPIEAIAMFMHGLNLSMDMIGDLTRDGPLDG